MQTALFLLPFVFCQPRPLADIAAAAIFIFLRVSGGGGAFLKRRKIPRPCLNG